jgi:hypothetical protein
MGLRLSVLVAVLLGVHSVSFAQASADYKAFWDSWFGGPKSLRDVPDNERAYCGNYVVVCRACVVDGPRIVYDLKTEQRVVALGDMLGTCITPDAGMLSAVDCGALRARIFTACRNGPVAPNSTVEGDARKSGARPSP